MSSNSAKVHYDNLDGLRTIACLGIIAMHIQANANYQINGWIWKSFIPSLTLGVYLFLIISGFGMFCGYYQKFKDGTVDLNSFYRKRYLKLLPFFSLLILIDVIMEHSADSLIEGLTELTMVFGLLPNNQPSVIGVSWTLGVIFLFYMLFPFFVFLCWNKKRAWKSFIVSIALNIFLDAYWLSNRFVVADFGARHNFLYCAPFFIGGGMLYLYREQISSFVSKHKLGSGLATVAAIIFFYALINKHFNKSGLLSFVLYYPMMIFALGPKTKLLSNSFTKHISGISFELYLAQMLAFRLLEKMHLLYVFGTGWISFIVTFVLTVLILIIAIRIYKTIEKKFILRLRAA